MFFRSVVYDLAAVAAIAILISLTVMWSEAKKEVIYLCGNFVQGTSHASVVNQLNTANFLTYHREFNPNGSTMIVSSPLHFGNIHCRIILTSQHRVADARVIM